MSSDKFPNTPWVTAIAVSPRLSEPGVYDVTIAPDWSIANLPLGGYLSSLLTHAVHTHFSLHHADLHQPDPITNHCSFISRASAGDPAVIRISVSKTGKQYSNVHARLYQSARRPAGSGSAPAVEVLIVEALITQGDLARERSAPGIRLPVASPIPREAMFSRSAGVEMVDPPEFRRAVAAATKIRRVLPLGTTYGGSWAHPTLGAGVRDEWISWRDGGDGGGGGFDVQALAMLMDNLRPPAFDFPGLEMGRQWMATLSLSVDVKRAPPVGTRGWPWLFLRAVVGTCEFGRYCMDITLLDEGGDVVALGRRTELVLGAERRLDKSKI